MSIMFLEEKINIVLTTVYTFFFLQEAYSLAELEKMIHCIHNIISVEMELRFYANINESISCYHQSNVVTK